MVLSFPAETAGQQIVRELTEKYVKQLNQSLLKAEEEYLLVWWALFGV